MIWESGNGEGGAKISDRPAHLKGACTDPPAKSRRWLHSQSVRSPGLADNDQMPLVLLSMHEGKPAIFGIFVFD